MFAWKVRDEESNPVIHSGCDVLRGICCFCGCGQDGIVNAGQCSLFEPDVDEFRAAAAAFIQRSVLSGVNLRGAIMGRGGPTGFNVNIGGYVHDPASGPFEFGTTKLRKLKPGEIAVDDRIELRIFDLSEIEREIRSLAQDARLRIAASK